MELTKVCSKCEKEFPATTEYFHKDKNCKYGVRSDCKKCSNARNKQFYKGNDEKVEQRNARNKAYYNKNAEKIKTRSRAYSKEYIKNNKEKCQNRIKKWNENNKDITRLYGKKREHLKIGLPATLSLVQWEKIKKDFDCKCSYCGITEESHLEKFNEQLHQEHFIAVSKGGEYTHNNIITACRSCNSSKRDKDFFKWYPTYEQYDKKREGFILFYLGYKSENAQQLTMMS